MGSCAYRPPLEILDRRLIKRNNEGVMQLLIKWSNSADSDAGGLRANQVAISRIIPGGQGIGEGRGNVRRWKG